MKRHARPHPRSPRRYPIYLRPEPEGGFTVFVPALPGCITYGKTLEEARTMATDAIRLYLEDVRASGGRVPVAAEGLLTSVEVTA